MSNPLSDKHEGLERRLHVATAAHMATVHWHQRSPMTWTEFVTWLDLGDPADHKDCGGYVGGLLQPTTGHSGAPDCTDLHRTRAGVVARSVLALDADHASPSFFVDAALLGCSLALHTTWSHSSENPRWRLLAPLSRDVTPDEYRLTTQALMVDLGYEQFDKGSAEAERLMHRPSTQGEYERHVLEGGPLDPDEWLARAKELGLDVEQPPPGHRAPPGDDSSTRDPAQGVHPYAATAIGNELARLDRLPRPWHPGAEWDNTTFEVACNLIEFGNANWTGYSLGEAEADLFRHAPADDAWGTREHAAKWLSATSKVGANARQCPDSSAGDDFDTWAVGDAGPRTTVAFGKAVEREAQALRVREAARQKVARENREGQVRPSLVRLTDFLAEPDQPVAYRVEGLWPADGRVVLAAQNKSGKTTLVGNVIRSLVDAEPFLDKFRVQRANRVVLVDNELSPNMIRRWLSGQGIEHSDAVDLVSLRGRLSTFNILDPVVRAEWAAGIGPADVLIFDCLRPALDALALSEDKESGRFLEALDELCAEADIKDLLLVHHMGHSNERSRGDSRLEDWPDAKWKLVRQDPDDPTSDRYFSAFGRDVDQAEVRLAFNELDRHLVVNGGSRRESRANAMELKVLDYVVNHPGCSQNAIEQGVVGDRNVIRRAIQSLDAKDDLDIRKVGQKQEHYPAAGL